MALENSETNKNVPNNIEFYNAITINNDNVSIHRDENRCIDCGLCKNVCQKREGIQDICDGLNCVNCGQCIQSCPVGALFPKNDIWKFKQALKKNKICIAYTAPAVRVSIGEEFEMEKGAFVQGKLITALRKLGFKYVFDVTFGADLTIVEEAAELVQRIKKNGVLPMFTSCCPSWVSYAEKFYPKLLPNLSTCKSPIGMQGAITKNYFAKLNSINPNEIFTVAITPCTSKKYEIARPEINGTDAVLTTKELSLLLKAEKIDFINLEDGMFDSILTEGSGAGMIFGNTGGVMEATLRTVYKILEDSNLPSDKLIFKRVRGLDNVKEAEINIGDTMIKVAVAHEMASAIPLLEEVCRGNSKYHYIEIMNCLGGCIGGGGQPNTTTSDEIDVKTKRINSLYQIDQNAKIRNSHQNPNIVKLYNSYLEYPLSDKSLRILHTAYNEKHNKY